MHELEEMGIETSKSSACWTRFHNDADFVFQPMSKENFGELVEQWDSLYSSADYTIIPTFTLQDILSHFESYTLRRNNNRVYLDIKNREYLVAHTVVGESELDCAFKMLKWRTENKFDYNQELQMW